MPIKRCRYEWLHRDPNKRLHGCGAWTRAKLADHGIPWPPPKGWKKRLEVVASTKEALRQYDLYVNFDGGCWPNPGGEATWGIVIKNNRHETVIEDNGRIPPGKTSNNVAEYAAVAKALEAINDLAGKGWRVLIRGDSQIVINKLGSKRVSGGLCRDACIMAQRLFRDAKKSGIHIDLQWVPREQNEQADSLTVASKL